MDHFKEGAWGAFGGCSGGLAGIWIKRQGDSVFKSFTEAFGAISPSKFANITVKEGDLIMIDSAGGGGYGRPAEREVELVLEDLREGFVSLEAVRKYYPQALGRNNFS